MDIDFMNRIQGINKKRGCLDFETTSFFMLILYRRKRQGELSFEIKKQNGQEANTMNLIVLL